MHLRHFFSSAIAVTLICIATNTFAQSGIISTIAGNGITGYTGDGGPALSAEIQDPGQITADASGNVYFVDVINSVIRKVSTAGIITTVAGNGSSGFGGDGGAATSAQLQNPSGVAVDASGNIFIADMQNNRIRKVNTSGTISTVVGTGTCGYTGDGGAATAATLCSPTALYIDNVGNLYLIDYGNSVVRKVSASGTITTVAGNGTSGYSGDGGPATSAKLFAMRGLCADNSGNIYIGDAGNYRIRKVSTSGTISTIGGTGFYGNSGDGGPATSAKVGDPNNMCVDGAGNLYFADKPVAAIRKISTSGIITTVAGQSGNNGFSGDGGLATSAQLDNPKGVAIDGSGRMVISDANNNRIRAVAGIAGVNQLSQPGIGIYPNPSNGSLHLFVPSAGQDARLTLINVLGQKVAEQPVRTNGNVTIDLGVAPGLYVLDIITGGEHYNTKITITR